MGGNQPLIGVLALQGGVREHIDALHRVGAATRAVRRPTDLDGLDGIVLPGGESGVIARLAAMTGVLPELRARISAGLPAFGTCAGLILLADRIENPSPGQDSIGGLDITVRRNAFGGQNESFDTDVVVTGVAHAVDASFIRAPIVVEHGPNVEVIARAGETIVGVRSGNMIGLSFHPEVTGDDAIHAMFVDHAAIRHRQTPSTP